MSGRRQEKMARAVKEVVCEVFTNGLSDPRIEGLISVTEVKMSADLKTGYVYLSILGLNPAAERKTFSAIERAGGYIQTLVGKELRSRFCPRLHFRIDDRLKKTMETMEIIEKASGEVKGSYNDEKQ